MKRVFRDMDEFKEYVPTLWEEEAIKTAVEHANHRFEDRLRHAVTVRQEVRTGQRISQEAITVTIYEWIKRFLARTHRQEVLAVTVAQSPYLLRLDLFELTYELEPQE